MTPAMNSEPRNSASEMSMDDRITNPWLRTMNRAMQGPQPPKNEPPVRRPRKPLYCDACHKHHAITYPPMRTYVG